MVHMTTDDQKWPEMNASGRNLPQFAANGQKDPHMAKTGHIRPQMTTNYTNGRIATMDKGSLNSNVKKNLGRAVMTAGPDIFVSRNADYTAGVQFQIAANERNFGMRAIS